MKGVLPVLVSVIDKAGDIDKTSMESLIRYLDSFRSCCGFWVAGTGGEEDHLTQLQRIQLAEVLLDNVDSDCFMMGLPTGPFSETVNTLGLYESMGVTNIHYMPKTAVVGERLIYDQLCQIADQGLKVWLYLSANYSKKISISMLETLRDEGLIVGCKYSTSDIVEMSAVNRLSCDDFVVIAAVIKTFLGNLVSGVSSSTSIEACILMPVIDEILKSFDEMQLQRAMDLQLRLNDYLARALDPCSTENHHRASEIKAILKRRGIIANNYPVLGFKGISSHDGDEVYRQIEEFGFGL